VLENDQMWLLSGFILFLYASSVSWASPLRLLVMTYLQRLKVTLTKTHVRTYIIR
jgi:hypothetical protein